MAKGVSELIRDFKELHPVAHTRIEMDAVEKYKARLIEEIKEGYVYPTPDFYNSIIALIEDAMAEVERSME